MVLKAGATGPHVARNYACQEFKRPFLSSLFFSSRAYVTLQHRQANTWKTFKMLFTRRQIPLSVLYGHVFETRVSFSVDFIQPRCTRVDSLGSTRPMKSRGWFRSDQGGRTNLPTIQIFLNIRVEDGYNKEIMEIRMNYNDCKKRQLITKIIV